MHFSVSIQTFSWAPLAIALLTIFSKWSHLPEKMWEQGVSHQSHLKKNQSFSRLPFLERACTISTSNSAARFCCSSSGGHFLGYTAQEWIIFFPFFWRKWYDSSALHIFSGRWALVAKYRQYYSLQYNLPNFREADLIPACREKLPQINHTISMSYPIEELDPPLGPKINNYFDHGHRQWKRPHSEQFILLRCIGSPRGRPPQQSNKLFAMSGGTYGSQNAQLLSQWCIPPSKQ
jgi:hypothetical protein